MSQEEETRVNTRGQWKASERCRSICHALFVSEHRKMTGSPNIPTNGFNRLTGSCNIRVIKHNVNIVWSYSVTRELRGGFTET